MSNLKFSVGMSKEWDCYGAGDEAMYNALKSIKKPIFVLLFTTVHYAKNIPLFKKVLEGCKSHLKKDVPLIGGTTTAFICPQGVFSRGVIVVVAEGTDADICSEYAGHIRPTPHHAAKRIASKMMDKLGNGKKKNKLMIEIMSGPKEPKVMTSRIVQRIAELLPHPILLKLRDALFYSSFNFLQYGMNNEEDVLHSLSEKLEEFSIIGYSTFDDLKDLYHYQCFGNKVMDESIVALGIATDDEVFIKRDLPLIRSGRKFEITTGWRDYCIDYINSKKATKQYVKEMGWPDDFIKAHIEQIFHYNFYYPVGFQEGGTTIAFPIGLYFGDTIATNRKIRSKKLEVLYTSSKAIIEQLESYCKEIQGKDIKFSMFIEGAEVPGTLGNRLYKLKEIIDKSLKDKPYVMIFGSGEHSKIGKEKGIFNNFSKVMMSIINQNN